MTALIRKIYGMNIERTGKGSKVKGAREA